MIVERVEHPAERAERALGMLCDGDPPTRGHLLVCKVDGLKLVASNAPCSSIREIVTFATQCLEHESRTSNMETSALSSMTYELAKNPEWQERIREESRKFGDAPPRLDDSTASTRQLVSSMVTTGLPRTAAHNAW